MAAFLVLTFRSSPLWATRSTSNATGAEQLRALQKTGLLRLTDLKNDPAKFFEAWPLHQVTLLARNCAPWSS